MSEIFPVSICPASPCIEPFIFSGIYIDVLQGMPAADVARLQIPRCDQTTRTFVNRNDFRMRLQMRLRASAPLESVVVGKIKEVIFLNDSQFL